MQKYHISDILTITDGRLIAVRGMEAVYDILDFMTDDSLMTHQLGRASKECAPWLLKRYPILGTPEFIFEIDCLVEMMKTESGKKDTKSLTTGWASKVALKFGIETELDVYPIPPGGYKKKEPISELAEMLGGTERILLVKT